MNATFSQPCPLVLSRLLCDVVLDPSFRCYLRTMPAILVPLSSSCLLVHVSRCVICLASPILYICLVICSSYSILSLSIVRSCVLLVTCLEEVYYYTAVGCRLPVFLFLFYFCRLGGIIVICGVRICKVAISIVQYT
jgi:hypothetical protein